MELLKQAQQVCKLGPDQVFVDEFKVVRTKRNFHVSVEFLTSPAKNIVYILLQGSH